MEILDWLKKAGIPEKDFKHHVVVVSANRMPLNSSDFRKKTSSLSGIGSAAASLFGVRSVYPLRSL